MCEDCCHLKVFDLLGEKAFVEYAFSISLPCFLMKTLNASLGLLCDQRIHEDVGSSSLHHWDLVHTVSTEGSWKVRSYCPPLNPSCQGPDTWAMESLAFQGCCPCLMEEESWCRVLEGILMLHCQAVHPDGEDYLA